MRNDDLEAYESVCQAGKIAYMAVYPPLLNHFGGGESKLHVFGMNGTEAHLPLTREDLPMTASLLSVGFMSEGRMVIGWDMKAFFSLVANKVGQQMSSRLLGGKFFDLCYAERFLGVSAEPPDDLQEAMVRASPARLGKQAITYAGMVHTPLAREVLPSVESMRAFDMRKGRSVCSWYLLEEVYNGRLKCVVDDQRMFNPHGLSEAETSRLVSPNTTWSLCVLDYSNMEPAVLRWLTGDEALGRQIDSGDMYARVAEVVGVGRDECKEAFLAVMYGQGTRSLADRLGISEDMATRFRNTLKRSFAKSWEWLDATEEEAAAKGVLTDRFGRRFSFGERPHRARNWSVSSPSATICLERLVALHRFLAGRGRVFATVHDGFHILLPPGECLADLVSGCRRILEDVSVVAPGLSLRASAKVGKWYGDLVEIKR